MNEQTTTTTTKRGRKPLGDAAMTPAERQRRRRELLRTEGDKHYVLRLNGLHQEWIEIFAKSNGISGTKALQGLVEASLDRYVGVMHRCERLRDMGATDADIEAFMQAHFLPALPSIEELEIPPSRQELRESQRYWSSSSR